MRQRISFRSISLKQFLISTVLPILVLFLALTWYDTRQSFRYTQEVYSGTLATGAGALESSFSELEQISFTPFLYSDVLETMLMMHNGFLLPNAARPDYLDLSRLETEYTLLLTKLLHSSQQNVISISFYPFGDGNGSCFSIHRDTAGISYSAVEPSYVQHLYDYTKPYGSRPVFMTLQPQQQAAQVFSLLRVIKDYDSGKELGVLRIDAQTKELCATLDGVDHTTNGCLVLTDGNGSLIYQSGQKKENLTYTTQTCPVGTEGWTLSLSTAMEDFQVSNLGSVWIIFLVTLLAYVSAFLLYRHRSANTMAALDSILYAIQQLQEGNLGYQCQVKNDQELKRIADALNETGQKLDQLIHRESEARAGRFRAEYLALQSQINPHFLYNILNGFIALNRMGERQLLEQSIRHLTKLFRYICSNSDTATVAQEADFIVQYLELQKLRFDDRIEYQVEVEPSAGEVHMPKLLVQPLVENCVVHGMPGNDETIHIQLRAYLTSGSPEDTTLILEIADDGVGFDPSAATSRVGLANVTQRLSFFHPDSRCDVQSAPGQGTVVRLTVPISQCVSEETGKEENHAYSNCR